ncbi:MAG TPA: hypothetical protein VEQ59_16850, partial [Polyangiaceae bacterium]|nr:hypothetical protein [Polyangiaceae bacterium]
MLRSSLHPLLPVVALAGAGLIVACGGEGDPTPQVNAGGSASGATSSGGSSKAGSSSGQPPSGGGGGKAGAPGSSGKSGEGNDGSNGGSDAGQGDAGSSSPGGSGGPVGHGGAPNVDYGSPEVPPAAWTNITGTFAGMESECGNMSRLFSNPRADQLVLGVARQ